MLFLCFSYAFPMLFLCFSCAFPMSVPCPPPPPAARPPPALESPLATPFAATLILTLTARPTYCSVFKMMARVAAAAGLPRSLAWPAAARGALSVSAMSSAARGQFRGPPRVIPRPARPTRTAAGPLQLRRRGLATRSNYEYFQPGKALLDQPSPSTLPTLLLVLLVLNCALNCPFPPSFSDDSCWTLAETTPFHRRRWVLATVGAVGVGTLVYVNHLEEVPMTRASPPPARAPYSPASADPARTHIRAFVNLVTRTQTGSTLCSFQRRRRRSWPTRRTRR